MMVSGFLPAAHPRPSTSPVMPGMGKPGTIGGVASAPPSYPAAANAKLLLASQHARGLRPLPPKSPSGGFGMFIEGSRTGEEKVVTRPTIPREPPPKAVDVAPSEPSQALEPTRDDGRAAKDRERVRKLEADLQKLQDQLKRKSADNNELKDANIRLTTSSESLKLRFEEQINRLLADVDTQSRKAAGGASIIDQLRQENETLSRELKSREEAATKTASAATSKFAESEAALRAALASKDAALKVEQDRHAATQNELSAGKQRLIDSERDSAAVRERLSADMASARDRENALLKQIASLRTQAMEAEEQLAQWKQRVTDCNEYVVKVCQPQFAVVKDESLVPLNGKPANPGEGFVLVPLQLLLEGYGLLPPDTKRRIATTYESQVAKRSTP